VPRAMPRLTRLPPPPHTHTFTYTYTHIHKSTQKGTHTHAFTRRAHTGGGAPFIRAGRGATSLAGEPPPRRHTRATHKHTHAAPDEGCPVIGEAPHPCAVAICGHRAVRVHKVHAAVGAGLAGRGGGGGPVGRQGARVRRAHAVPANVGHGQRGVARETVHAAGDDAQALLQAAAAHRGARNVH
jgi:hypothetical protein